MKISNVRAILTEEDILSIVQDYVKVEGLEIEKVEIKELITLYGTFKKGVKIPFKVDLGFGNIHENIINIIILKINVAKVGILSGIKNFAINKILSAFEIDGVEANHDTIAVDLRIIQKYVPFVNFKLNGIKTIDKGVEIEVEDISYVEDKKVEEIKPKKKTTDGYTKLRNSIQEKIPDKYKNLAEYALIIPDIIALFVRLLRDERVDIKTKLLIGGVTAYMLSPIDAITNLIPVVGELDDIAIAFFTLDKILNEVDKEIILENWQGEDNIVDKVSEGIGFITNVVGSQNISKIMSFIKNITKKKNICTISKKNDCME